MGLKLLLAWDKPLGHRIDLEGVKLSKISQTDKGKSYDLMTCETRKQINKTRT